MSGLRCSIAALFFWGMAQGELIRFDGTPGGSTPRGWNVGMTHSGGAPQWKIERDDTAPSPPFVLVQTSTDRTAGRFPLAVWDKAFIRDGEVRVSFRTLGGTVDQAAGIIWRFQDANNYYIVRANALENNVVLYKVEKGIRRSIAPKGLPSRSYGVKREVPRDKWNSLGVVFEGDHIRIFFNGVEVFEAEDSTFRGPGKTGLWTKADSVISFDDFFVDEH